MNYRKEALMKKSSYQDGGVEGLAQKRAGIEEDILRDRDHTREEMLNPIRRDALQLAKNRSAEGKETSLDDIQNVARSIAVTDTMSPRPGARPVEEPPVVFAPKNRADAYRRAIISKSQGGQGQEGLARTMEASDMIEGVSKPEGAYRLDPEPNEIEVLEKMWGKPRSEWGEEENRQYYTNKAKVGGNV